MALSGIRVEEDVVKFYEELRFKKQAGGVILKIQDELISLEKEVDGDFSTMVANLPPEEPRYVLYDVEMKNRAGIDTIKTVFLFWLPMESPVRMRMLYASTKAVITKEFRGIAAQIQEDDKSYLNLEKIVEKVNKTQGINTQAF